MIASVKLSELPAEILVLEHLSWLLDRSFSAWYRNLSKVHRGLTRIYLLRQIGGITVILVAMLLVL
ncbi:MAG: hypothetical protein GX964_00385 [Syntrophomonadaceae bacterium]|jgi:hypothetical protein|nr:hypothetical protein [Syntrophomonadaceae bacterium]